MGGACAWGATCTVTSLADTNTSGTLRNCLANLSTGTAVDTNLITITATGTITLTSTLPDIENGVTINGPGANELTIDGGGQFQTIIIGTSSGAPAVSISGLTFANGKTSGDGGAIFLETGVLTVSDTAFSGNTAADGGAITNTAGTLTVTGDTFTQNSATADGGAIASANGLDAVTLTATNDTFSGNSSGGNGGAINSVSNADLANNTFEGNSATGTGGAFFLGGAVGLTANNTVFVGNSTGGAIVNGGTGTVTAGNNVYYNNGGNNCTNCGSNPADAGSNPLTLPLGNYGGTTETFLPQPGSAAICAGLAADVPVGVSADQRGFPMNPASNNSCSSGSVDAGAVQTNYIQVTSGNDSGNGTLRNAITTSAGEGDIDFKTSVTSITLSSGTLDLALPASGVPGINIIGPGANTLTVNGGGSSSNFSVFTVESKVSALLYGLTISNGNTTTGGGIDNSGSLTLLSGAVTNSAAGNGGGIDNASTGALLLLDSTISGNTSPAGGGIYNAGGSLQIVESTISGNSASGAGPNPGLGGGIFSNGSFTAINSTVSGNSTSGTPQGDGGGIYMANGTVSLANTIVSGNTASGGGNADVSGTESGSGNVIGGSVALSGLGLYGPNATVQTQILLPGGTSGNPAICGGLAVNLPSGITTDERGEPNSNTTYSGSSASNPCVDAGAVQTNYSSLSFTTNPPATVALDQGFGVAVTLDESGQAFASASPVNVSVTLSSGTLDGTGVTNGTGTAGTDATGVATYSGLNATAGSGLTLDASLQLNATASLSGTSSSFGVTSAPTKVGLQTSSSSAAVGQPVTLTATVSPSGTGLVAAAGLVGLSGSVTFQAGSQTLTCGVGSQTFSYSSTSGTATETCITADLPAGSPDSVTAVYSGDSNYQMSPASPVIHVTVSQSAATTSLTCTSTDPTSANCATSVGLNATVTFTESVSGPSGSITPTGTVTFEANGTKISGCGSGGVVTLSSGSAACSTSSLKANTYSIVAKYSGDSNYSKVTDSLSLQVGQANTTISVASSSPTSTVNQSVQFTATVGPASASPQLNGTVTLVDTSNSNATICAGSVDPTSQQFSCSAQGLSLGAHKIEAKYGSDSNYGGSTSSLLTQQVNAGAATIPSFSSSSNPSVVNNNVIFTATVSVPSGPTPPAGNVHFTANGNTIAGCDKVTLTLSSPGATSGTAPCTTSSLAASTTPYTIVATYTDTNGNFTSASATLNPAQTVSAAATTVLITAAPSTTTVNVPVTYTVTATAASTAYVLTGTAQVSDNGNVICSGLALTQAAGSATGTNQSCTESNLTAGVHTITATYNLSGSDPNNGTGSGSTTVPVAPATTSVIVISSQNPSVVANPNNVSDSVTFAATVASTGTISVPLQGSVTFTENGLVLQGPRCPSPAPVNAAGLATCTTSSLPAGADTILAVYSNDANYTGSSGYLSANNQVVPQTVQDFSLVISSTPPVVVSQGYTSSSDLFTPQTISVVPISIQGFATATTPSAAPLNLACSVSAVFSPASTPTLPLCSPATATLAVSGTGAQGAVPIVVDATQASAGIYAVQETGTDPTTGIAHSASFQVTVDSASDPVTVVSGATTGNGGNLSFMLPAGVTLSNIVCKSVSGPNLTSSVSPDSLGITCAFDPTSITNSSTSMAAVQIAATVGTSGTTGGASASNARHTNLLVAGLFGLPLFGLVGLIGGRKSSRSVFFRLMVIAIVCVVAFQALGCGGSFATLPANSSGGGGKTPPGVYKILVVGTGSDGQTYEAVLQLDVQL